MKANELRELAPEDLQKKVAELERDLFNLRFQLHTGHLEDSSRLKAVKKDVARIKTVLNDKKN